MGPNTSALKPGEHQKQIQIFFPDITELQTNDSVPKLSAKNSAENGLALSRANLVHRCKINFDPGWLTPEV